MTATESPRLTPPVLMAAPDAGHDAAAEQPDGRRARLGVDLRALAGVHQRLVDERADAQSRRQRGAVFGERELAMATGQYGTAATERFRAALEASRRDVAEAFRLRMTLEEEPAPDLAVRRETLSQIIALCQAADARLDAESEDFDRLRDLEGRAAEVADEVDQRRTALEAALPAAAAAWQDLDARYAGPPVTAVATNVDQARERLSFAAAATARAREAMAADRPAGDASTVDSPAGAPGPSARPGPPPASPSPAVTGLRPAHLRPRRGHWSAPVVIGPRRRLPCGPPSRPSTRPSNWSPRSTGRSPT